MGANLSRMRSGQQPSKPVAAKGTFVSYSWSRRAKGVIRRKHEFHVDELLNALRNSEESSSAEVTVAEGIRVKLAVVKKASESRTRRPFNFPRRPNLEQEAGRIPEEIGFKIYCLDGCNDLCYMKISLTREGSNKKLYAVKAVKALDAGESFELEKPLSTKKLRNRSWSVQNHFFVKENHFTVVLELAVMRTGILTQGNRNADSDEISEDKSLAANLLSLRQDPNTCDVVLVTASGKRYPVHSVLLKARSAALASDLDSLSGDLNKILLNSKIHDEIADALVDFIYTDDLRRDLDVPLAEGLVIAAEMYALDGLKEMTEKFLVSKLDANNAVDFLRIGHKGKASLLTRRAAELIADKLQEFSGNEKWIQLVEEAPIVCNYVIEVIADKERQPAC